MVAQRGSGSQIPVSDLSAQLLGGNIYIIRGRSEPGNTIRVAGRETLVGKDGSFQIQVTAQGSDTQLTIEALDPRGNASQYRVPLGGSSRGRT